MGKTFKTYYPTIIDEFKELDHQAYHEVIDFYHKNSHRLDSLSDEACLEIKVIYGNALFETGDYAAFIQLSDELIEAAINLDATIEENGDLFTSLLFKKAAALYHSCEYENSTHILTELLKINPDHPMAAYLLRKARIKLLPPGLQNLRNFGMFGVFVSAIVIMGELLLIKVFYDDWAAWFEWSRNTLFISSLSMIIFSDVVHRLNVFYKTNLWINEQKKRKGEQLVNNYRKN